MASSAREEFRRKQAAEAARAKQRKVIGMVAAVLALVLLLVVGFWAVGDRQRQRKAEQTTQGAQLAQAVTSIPASTFDAVGVGEVTNGPQAIPGAKPADKPRVLYIGAEFCPYCAMERLSLTAALARFGTFQGLQDTLSSPNEGPISNIPTVTYKDSSYTSDHLAFTAVETADRFNQPMDSPTAEDAAIFQKYAPKGGIPFTWYGTAFTNWAGYDGSGFAGRTAEDLAAALRDPNSTETRRVVGGANVITAQICRETGGKPADVCTSPGVTAAAKTLK